MLFFRTSSVLLGTALLLTIGCKKPEEALGVDLLPEGQGLGVERTDTTSLLAYSVQEEPVRTSNLSRVLVGSYLDSEFGLVKTGFVAQVRLSTNSIGAGQNNSMLEPDSIVLSLAFDPLNPIYGNPNTQTFQVFEITDTLSGDSTYKNDDFPNIIIEDLVADQRGDITPRPFDGAVVGADTLPPQLRIRLDNSFARRLLDQWGTSNLSSNTEFLEYLHGLYVTTDNGTQFPYQQGTLGISLLDENSKLTLYYRNTLPGEEDTVAFDFPINDNSVRYSVCEGDLQQAINADLSMLLLDSTLGQQKIFVRACGGYRTRIHFPHIRDYQEQGWDAVAKAELIVPVNGSIYPYHPPPAQLFLFRKNDEGDDATIPDQLESYGLNNGLYDEDAQEYRFNITRYVQGLISGTYEDTGAQIVPGSSGVTVNRVVLNGPESSNEPTRLTLTFTDH